MLRQAQRKYLLYQIWHFYRVLSKGGLFIYLTFGQLHFHRCFLTRPETTLEIKELGDSFHYYFFNRYSDTRQCPTAQPYHALTPWIAIWSNTISSKLAFFLESIAVSAVCVRKITDFQVWHPNSVGLDNRERRVGSQKESEQTLTLFRERKKKKFQEQPRL